MSKEIILDSSFVVAELDEKDYFHPKAKIIRKQIETQVLCPILLDAVVNEVFTVIGKRLERTGKTETQAIFDALFELTQPQNIVFVYPEIKKLWIPILQKMRASSGRLSFHDSLILTFMEKLRIHKIATFDKDFEEIEGVEILH